MYFVSSRNDPRSTPLSPVLHGLILLFTLFGRSNTSDKSPVGNLPPVGNTENENDPKVSKVHDPIPYRPRSLYLPNPAIFRAVLPDTVYFALELRPYSLDFLFILFTNF